jgi:excisionase family DNA binding protein
MDSAILTVAEAAAVLGITGHGVRYLIREGRLRAKCIGEPGPRCHYEIRRADLDKIVRLPRGRRPKNDN